MKKWSPEWRKQKRIEWLQNKQCTVCGKQDEKTLSGKRRCERCAKRSNGYHTAMYEKRKAEHRCGHCGVNLPENWFYVLCEQCKSRESRYYKEYYSKKKGSGTDA